MKSVVSFAIIMYVALVGAMRQCYVAGERHGLNKSTKVLAIHEKIFRNQTKAIAYASETIGTQHDTIKMLLWALSNRDATKQTF